MPKQIKFNVKGIEGDAFDRATVFFPEEFGEELSSGVDVPTRRVPTRRKGIVRKKPGRTTHHQLILTPGEQTSGEIPEPESPIDIDVKLYKDGTLVAVGTDTVAPPGPPVEVIIKRVTARIDEMLETIDGIQELTDPERCGSGVCETVLGNSFVRADKTRDARAFVADREWAAATDCLEAVKEIVEGDIERLESAESDEYGEIHGEVLALERELLAETVEALGVMPGDNVT